MLHPLNPPSCTAELNEVILLQRRTLEYASLNVAYHDNDYRAALGAAFVDWLLVRKVSSAKNDKVVRTFFQNLQMLVQCSAADKQQVLADFDLDQTYYQQLDDPAFRFSFQVTKTVAAHQMAASCLIAFFEFLGLAGYPAGIINTPLGLAGFNKIAIVDGYKATNEFVEYVCPSCDSILVDSPNANPEGYTLEHYFPKSIYPSICLHPLNLIPMCSKCNAGKEDHDPLAPPSNPPFRVPYDEVFHPTKRPVRQHADLEFTPTPLGREQMSFVARPGGKQLTEAIAAYGILYQIPERWRVLWKRVEQRIDLTVKRAIRMVTYNGANLDIPLFNTAVSLAIKDLEDNCGLEHFNYPAARWLRWAQQNKFQDLAHDFGVQ